MEENLIFKSSLAGILKLFLQNYKTTVSPTTYARKISHMHDFDEFLVKRFITTDCLHEWHIDYLVVTHPHHDITLSLNNSFDSPNTCTACQDAVVSRRAASTLQMP